MHLCSLLLGYTAFSSMIAVSDGSSHMKKTLFMLAEHHCMILIDMNSEPTVVTVVISFGSENRDPAISVPHVEYKDVAFELFDSAGKKLQCAPADKRDEGFTLAGTRGWAASGRYLIKNNPSTDLERAEVRWKGKHATVLFKK